MMLSSPSQPTWVVFICKEPTFVDDVFQDAGFDAPEWKICPEDCARDNEDLPQSQELHAMGGNGLRRKKQTLPSSEEWCGQD